MKVPSEKNRNIDLFTGFDSKSTYTRIAGPINEYIPKRVIVTVAMNNAKVQLKTGDGESNKEMDIAICASW